MRHSQGSCWMLGTPEKHTWSIAMLPLSAPSVPTGYGLMETGVISPKSIFSPASLPCTASAYDSLGRTGSSLSLMKEVSSGETTSISSRTTLRPRESWTKPMKAKRPGGSGRGVDSQRKGFLTYSGSLF